MREILFRGKDCSEEWTMGYYCSYGYTGEEKHYIIPYYASCLYDTKEIDCNTLGQYTGLKDKNGVKIFEGDYLLCAKFIGGNWVEHICERGYVECKHGAFGLHRKGGYYRSFQCWLEDYEYEVIGNIYDNPELLEEKN